MPYLLERQPLWRQISTGRWGWVGQSRLCNSLLLQTLFITNISTQQTPEDLNKQHVFLIPEPKHTKTPRTQNKQKQLCWDPQDISRQKGYLPQKPLGRPSRGAAVGSFRRRYLEKGKAPRGAISSEFAVLVISHPFSCTQERGPAGVRG